MGDHYAVHQAVVVEGGVHGCLPVDCVASGIGLDSGQVGIFHVDKKPGSLAEVAEQDMPYDLSRAFAPCSQGWWIGAELENEAVLPVDRLLPNATRVGEHACGGQWIETLLKESSQDQSRYRVFLKQFRQCGFGDLESSAEGTGGAFGGMGAEPGGVAPHDLAIGTGVDLAAADSELDVPHVRGHLPEHEATGLRGARRDAAGPDDFGCGLELRRHHSHLPGGVGVADGSMEPQAA